MAWISPEVKRRLRLLVQRLNGGDPSRTTNIDDGFRTGEGEIRGVDSLQGHK